RNVRNGWKPLLWYVKGDYNGGVVYDVFQTPPDAEDKKDHHWGQSQGAFDEIIERFTFPGDTIADPFVGGGTTGIAALKQHRKFIGIDCDEEAIKTTRERLFSYEETP
ncbi:MAG: site-specific DNA-methyltransferase, partial [Chloroflexi bacterium]|nr:site-specific DNA-methyltransferase [Chloroflexota bacterium]